MKVLLVLPAAEHLRVKMGQPVPKRKMLRFNVSLTTVAALTPAEHEVLICDENIEPLDFNINIDLVGVSFMTALAPQAYEIADEFRRRGVTTVAGGYHPTLCTAEVLEHFDIVVTGEAEKIWGNVLRDVERGQFKRVYKSQLAGDFLQVPVPRRELLGERGKYYITTNAVQTGRGCNHSCKFCSVTAFFEHRYRNRSLEEVLDELKNVPRNFMFIDDNIICDREYAKKLFAAMIPMKKRWISQCSIEIADEPELLALASKAGCVGLFVGVETISLRNLESMEKQFNEPDGYMRRIRAIRKMGIGVQAGIIVGMDCDDIATFNRTLRFLQKAKIDALQLAILTPQPGTPLRDEFEKAGRIIDNNWAHYDYRHVVIQPKCMTAVQLQEGADWLYNQFYRLDRIIVRAIRGVFTMGLMQGYLIWRLNVTYRYDNKREGIVGRNPAASLSPWYEYMIYALKNMFVRFERAG